MKVRYNLGQPAANLSKDKDRPSCHTIPNGILPIANGSFDGGTEVCCCSSLQLGCLYRNIYIYIESFIQLRSVHNNGHLIRDQKKWNQKQQLVAVEIAFPRIKCTSCTCTSNHITLYGCFVVVAFSRRKKRCRHRSDEDLLTR